MLKATKSQWATLLCSSLSCFVAYIDFAIVNTALPAIQKDLAASVLQLQWIMNAFVIAVSVTMVMMGRLSDFYGRRLLNIVGVFLFGLFSLLAGKAFDPLWLILCRMMQGIATAIIIPSSLALISHAFDKKHQSKAVGIWNSLAGIGLAIGPVLGGFIVSALNWRWIFYINIPFAAISLVLALFFVEESKLNKRNEKIDFKGFALITIGITSFISGVMQAPDWGWVSWPTLSLIVFGLFILCLFYMNEKKAYSIIPFHLFSNRTFLSCCLARFTLAFVIWSVFFLTPLYLETIQHERPYTVGLMLTPITACMVILSPIIGYLKVSFKKLILVGLLAAALSVLGQSFFGTQSHTAYTLLSFLLLGISWPLITNPTALGAMASLPNHQSGTATGVLTTLQNIGGSIGLAITGTLFRDIYNESSSSALFLKGYHVAMWVLFGVIALSFFILLTLMKDQKRA